MGTPKPKPIGLIVLLAFSVPVLGLAQEPRLPYSRECDRWLKDRAAEGEHRLRGQPVPRSALPPPGDCRPEKSEPKLAPALPLTAPSRPAPPSPTITRPAKTKPPSTIVYPPAVTPAKPQPERPKDAVPIPEAEAAEQVKGVLDRIGEPGAKCERKQYGSGWVTVCE